MRKEYSRFTPRMMRSLGYPVRYNMPMGTMTKEQIKQQTALVKGRFANIIDLLFDSNDMSLDNAVSKYVSENAPEDVRMFVQNVLMCPVQSLAAAPDDDTAFEMIIPRHAQSQQEMQPYLDNMRQIVTDARAAYEAAQLQQNTSE
ncbi:MAG: hypothetical protein K2J12_07470 [Muribaculaceae bacterium]|nr:hypothetical protein [Muribaculaceae bacterium]